jgi:hypothetical protein
VDSWAMWTDSGRIDRVREFWWEAVSDWSRPKVSGSAAGTGMLGTGEGTSSSAAMRDPEKRAYYSRTSGCLRR